MTDIELVPKMPYNFPLCAAIFSGGDPAIRTYEHGVYRQALEIDGQPFGIRLRPDAEKHSSCLILSVFPDPTGTGVGEADCP